MHDLDGPRVAIWRLLVLARKRFSEVVPCILRAPVRGVGDHGLGLHLVGANSRALLPSGGRLALKSRVPSRNRHFHFVAVGDGS